MKLYGLLVDLWKVGKQVGKLFNFIETVPSHGPNGIFLDPKYGQFYLNCSNPFGISKSES